MFFAFLLLFTGRRGQKKGTKQVKKAHPVPQRLKEDPRRNNKTQEGQERTVEQEENKKERQESPKSGFFGHPRHTSRHLKAKKRCYIFSEARFGSGRPKLVQYNPSGPPGETVLSRKVV